MDMLMDDQIAAANLTDWRKLAQGLHARYVVDDFATGARFVVAVGEAGDELGRHPRESISKGCVEVNVAREVAAQRIAVVAGGTVVDDTDAPSLTVIADQDGNRGVLCAAESPAAED